MKEKIGTNSLNSCRATMVDDATFLAAILAAPDDDGPRLVYADWLEEHGDTERSEFIRVQIELAHTPVEEGRASILRRREAELLRQHRDEWLKPLTDRLAAERGAEPLWPQPVGAIQNLFEMFSPSVPIGQPPDEPPFLIRAATERLLSEFERSPLQLLLGAHRPKQFEFRRGFVESATLTAHEFRLHRATLFALVPLRELRAMMGSLNGVESALFDLPELARLDRLRLQGVGFFEWVDAFAASPRLGNLRLLDLRDLRLSPDDIGQVVGLRNLRGLRDLNLSNNALRNEGVIELALNPSWANLEELHLSKVVLGDHGLEVLAASPILTRLSVLDVSDNLITPAGLLALLESPLQGRLINLDLSLNRIGETQMSILRRRAAGLFAGSRGQPPWVDRLLSPPWVDSLQRLDLTGNALSRDILDALKNRYGPRLICAETE